MGPHQPPCSSIFVWKYLLPAATVGRRARHRHCFFPAHGFHTEGFPSNKRFPFGLCLWILPPGCTSHGRSFSRFSCQSRAAFWELTVLSEWHGMTTGTALPRSGTDPFAIQMHGLHWSTWLPLSFASNISSHPLKCLEHHQWLESVHGCSSST